MFVEQLRWAVEASPRVELAKVAGLLWRAYAAGHVTEAEASELSDLIEAKRALPAPPPRPRLHVGSRPRTPESLARRRRWVAGGLLPPQIASRFTAAETAVLAVVAAEVRKHARCTLTISHIAALAGVSETTVRNALREGRALGLLHVEERRVAAWRNLPNRITVVSREWLSWLRMRRRGVGANPRTPRLQENNEDMSAQRNRLRAAEGRPAGGGAARRGSHGARERWSSGDGIEPPTPRFSAA